MDANELYDPDFRKLIKSKKQTIIIPIGSIEQHGAHLPITTDSDIVTEIASRLAKKCGFIVFPTISYGVSYEHEPLTNASITKDNLENILDDILWSLQDLDAKDKLTCIILNGHHGNAETLSKIEEYFAPSIIVKGKLTAAMGNVRVYSYWHFMEHEFDHAGFVETSLMLAISDKVKMEKAKKGLIIEKLSKLEQSTASKLSTQRGGFPRITENGVWGDPRDATKKDGRKFLAEIVRNLTKECQS